MTVVYMNYMSVFSVVSFRKANKLGVIFKVTPLAQDGDVKVHNYIALSCNVTLSATNRS